MSLMASVGICVQVNKLRTILSSASYLVGVAWDKAEI